jgi:hypothetical protein
LINIHRIGKDFYRIESGATVQYDGNKIRITTKGRRPTRDEVSAAASIAKGPWIITMDKAPKLKTGYGLIELRRKSDIEKS